MIEYDQEHYQTLLTDITAENRVGNLSDWERGFISTCFDMVDKNIMLSEKQRGLVESIWDKATRNG